MYPKGWISFSLCNVMIFGVILVLVPCLILTNFLLKYGCVWYCLPYRWIWCYLSGYSFLSAVFWNVFPVCWPVILTGRLYMLCNLVCLHLMVHLLWYPVVWIWFSTLSIHLVDFSGRRRQLSGMRFSWLPLLFGGLLPLVHIRAAKLCRPGRTEFGFLSQLLILVEADSSFYLLLTETLNCCLQLFWFIPCGLGCYLPIVLIYEHCYIQFW